MDVISVGPLTSYGLHLGAALIYKPKALLSIVSSVFIISFSSRGSCLSAKGLVCQTKYTPYMFTVSCSSGLLFQHVIKFIDLQV